MNEINVNDIVMWNLVYIHKCTFRRIDERPIYFFHNTNEVECLKVEKYLWRGWWKRQMPWTRSCTWEGPSQWQSHARRGNTAWKRSSEEGQVHPQGGERNEQGTGGEGEGGGGKPCEWWQCGGPKGGAGESSNSHGKSFSISIYVSVIT